MHELLNPEPGTPENLIQKLKAEAHQRITWPMYNIVLSLLALSALLCGQLNRRGQWKRILYITLISVGCVTVAMGINGLIGKYPALTAVAYLNILVFSLCPIAILHSNSYNILSLIRRSNR